jgi:hypothetical protein
MPTRSEATQMEKTATPETLRQMILNAQDSIKDWSVASRINPSMSRGAAFNILKGAIDSKSELARRNLLMEFGEFHPGYQKKQRSKRSNVPVTMHQEPEFLT